jgi:hypothetical protein
MVLFKKVMFLRERKEDKKWVDTWLQVLSLLQVETNGSI